jgi:hypothetical protein
MLQNIAQDKIRKGSSTTATGVERLVRNRPIAMDALKTAPTGMKPPNL